MKQARPESWDWLLSGLENHDAVENFERDGKFIVRITKRSGRSLIALFCDEYLMGLEVLDEALRIAPDLDALVTSSVWNRYSREAKIEGIERGVGVFRGLEFLGALWKDGADFVAHLSRDQRDAMRRGEDPY